MTVQITVNELIERGLDAPDAEKFIAKLKELDPSLSATEFWQQISRHILKPSIPFDVHQYVHAAVFADWDPTMGPVPAWIPDHTDSANIAWLMRMAGKKKYHDLYKWSISERAAFWDTMIERLDIRFQKRYSSVLDLTYGNEHPRWLTGAKFNIIDSCFNAPDDSPAIIYQQEDREIQQISIADLRLLVGRVANGLVDLGLQQDDMIAIDMPMTVEAVAIFLGAVAAGCVVVTIADSFAPHEIKMRLQIAPVKCIFTQDYSLRSGKQLGIYEKVTAAEAPQAIVLPFERSLSCPLRKGDITWDQFLSEKSEFSTVARSSTAFTGVLFSSGTTAQPKAIPWDNTTPIKSAIDGYLHHDIHPGDVLCWPTNLGWMMGPWLVYASLMNRATVGLYYGAPTTRQFGQFVQDAGVTMLGLVPSIVTAWKDTGCIQGLDWSHIRVFSSTGECSNPRDMLFLMSLAGYKPVIEYCGGTEIGGGYITGTVVQPSAPGTFSTPALGSELVILDEHGQQADAGEVFLAPPSMGLSLELLNSDHHEVYYAGTPRGPNGQLLRRHGDQMQHLPNGYFRAHGRVDDSMNLGGVKVSSQEIEEIIKNVPGIRETAAIAVQPPEGGPAKLIVYAVPADNVEIDLKVLKSQMQQEIRNKLNPLFKIHDVVIIEALPRTASNKVMRRALRAEYDKKALSTE